MTKGFYWHVYHDGLLDWCWDYEERVAYIKANKPKYEQELRLHLLQPVKGQLPEPLIEAGNAFEKVRNARQKDAEALQERRDGDDHSKAWDVYLKAWDASVKAEAALGKALNKYQPEIEALHAQECPDCPFDGTTIFGGER